MFYGLEDGLTVFLFFVAIIIVLWAQFKIKNTYKKYRMVQLKNELSGQEIARKILDNNALTDIYIVETKGELSDHYDPRRKVIRLSNSVFNGTSVAAASIAAHEVGHAIQDKENYTFMKIRSFLVPIVNFITYAAYFVALISIFAGMTGYLMVSILMIVCSLIFQLVTLPVEINASKRAKEELMKLNIVDSEEQKGAAKVLSAAAFTYVASFISSLLQLLRIIIMLGNRRD